MIKIVFILIAKALSYTKKTKAILSKTGFVNKFPFFLDPPLSQIFKYIKLSNVHNRLGRENNEWLYKTTDLHHLFTSYYLMSIEI